MTNKVIDGWVAYHPSFEQVSEHLGREAPKFILYEILDEELLEDIKEANENEDVGNKQWRAVRARLVVVVED